MSHTFHVVYVRTWLTSNQKVLWCKLQLGSDFSSNQKVLGVVVVVVGGGGGGESQLGSAFSGLFKTSVFSTSNMLCM